MTEEEIRKIANNAFNESIMNNLDSSIIFKYIQGLEKENQELKKQIEYLTSEKNFNTTVINESEEFKKYKEEFLKKYKKLEVKNEKN